MVCVVAYRQSLGLSAGAVQASRWIKPIRTPVEPARRRGSGVKHRTRWRSSSTKCAFASWCGWRGY